FKLLRDAVELHERGITADGPQTLEAKDRPLMLTFARPGADERRELQDRRIAAKLADRTHRPLLLARGPFAQPKLEEPPGEGIEGGSARVWPERNEEFLGWRLNPVLEHGQNRLHLRLVESMLLDDERRQGNRLKPGRQLGRFQL